MVIFHTVYNIAIIIFMVLILAIFNPLKQVQKMFRKSSNNVIQNLSISPSESSVDYYYTYEDEELEDDN